MIDTMEELGLNDLFTDFKDMNNDSLPSMSIDEINEALDLTLKEMVQNHNQSQVLCGNSMVHEHHGKDAAIRPVKKRRIIDPSHATYSKKVIESNPDIPPSPESVLSDSRVNSPYITAVDSFNPHLGPAPLLVPEKLKLKTTERLESDNSDNIQAKKNQDLLIEYEKLKVAFSRKSQALKRAMEELKKSEIRRLQVIKENKELQKSLSGLIFQQK